MAIAAVVVFHLVPDWLPGGFTGVAVFFVISGFMITRLINAALEERRFRFADFYARRIRRLMPSLLVVVLVSLVAGFDVLLRTEFLQLGKHALAGLTYTTNFVLWGEGGYFDRAAHFKPLHHLWSLAVEEQFYLLWPALMLVTSWLTRRERLLILSAVLGFSFGFCVWFTGEDANGAFFLPMGRLWQFGLGALVALRPPARAERKHHAWLALLGAGLVAAAFLFAPSRGHARLEYPGWIALLPTVGAALIIDAGPQAWLNRVILRSRPLVELGLISYALYLWHWPIAVFLRLVQGPLYWTINDSAQLGPGLTIAAVVSSVALAALTTRWVERPIRFEKKVSVPTLLLATLALAGFSGLVLSGQLGSRNQRDEVDRIEQARTDVYFPTPSLAAFEHAGQKFHRAGEGPPSVLFIGDSNMEQYAPAIEARLAKGPSRAIAFITKGGCAPFVALDGCAPYFEAMRELAEAPGIDTVVFAGQWALYFDNPRFTLEHTTLSLGSERTQKAFSEFAAWLTRLRSSRRVVLVLNIPSSIALDPAQSARRSWLEGVTVQPRPVARQALEQLLSPVTQKLKAVAALAGAEVIDPFETLCDAQWCPAFTEEGQPIYKDAYHVRPFFIRQRFHAFDALLDPA